MSLQRKLIIAAAVIVGLPLLVLLALPFFINANDFRPVLQTQLSEKLHRPVTLGDMQLKTFPLSIRIADVLIGQPAGYPVPQPFLQAKEVFVGVSLFPLLRKEVEVNSVRLASPRIELVRNTAGRWNYVFGDTTTEPSSSSGGAPASFTLDELKISDGEVSLHDLKSNTPRDVYEHIDVKLSHLGAGRSGSVTGDVRLDTMAAVLHVQSDFTLGDAIAAKGSLNLKSDRSREPLQVDFDVKREGATTPLLIQRLVAKVGSLSANVTGSVDTAKTPAALQLHAQTESAPISDLTHLASLYGAKFPDGLKIDGNLQTDIRVTGTTEAPLLSGSLEATKAQISAKELAEPVRASELRVAFTPETLTTRPFVLETGATQVTAQATVTNYSSAARKISASIQTNGAKIEELLRMAAAYGVKPAGMNGSGTVSLDMKVNQAGKKLDYAGSGGLKDVSITPPGLPKPITIANASIKFSDDRVVLEQLRAGLGSMHLDGSASLKDFAKPDLQFNAHIDEVNVAELQQIAGGAPSSGGKGPSKPPAITAGGTVTIDKIINDKIVLTNVKTTIHFDGGVLKLDPLTATLFGGQQSGAMTADLRNAAPVFTVKSKLTNIDTNQMLTAISPLHGVLSGALSGNVDLQATARPNEDLARGLNGNVQIQMGQGKLAGIHLLNEMASIAKFLGYAKQQDNFTNIVKLSGSMNIQNGLANTNDLFLDLGQGTISGAGTIGLADQTLKMKVTSVLSKEFAQKGSPGGQIGGLLTTALSNQKGELVVPALISGTFAQPRFQPDPEQIASMKLKGLLPTASNPAALTTGIKGIVDSITGKQPEGTPGDPNQPQNGITDLINQFRKKKPTTAGADKKQ